MYAKHPDIARRWSAEYGNKIVSGARKVVKNRKRK
jgi:hypothetical protein